MTFQATVNGNLLYESPDGREAWIILNPEKGLAFIVTDIHNMGAPYNSVGFNAETLRAIADLIDAGTDE